MTVKAIHTLLIETKCTSVLTLALFSLLTHVVNQAWSNVL